MATRRTIPPPPQPPNLTVEEMRRGIVRLNRRIADLEAFDPHSVQTRYAPEVTALGTAIDETLAAVFGHNSVQHQRYRRAARLGEGPSDPVQIGWLEARSGGFGRQAGNFRQYLAEGKQRAIMLLKQAVRGLEEEIGDHEALIAPASVVEPAPAAGPKPADQPIPEAAIIEIRETVGHIKQQLSAVTSNVLKAEIDADIIQVEAETERPVPRRRFMVMYLESLRDNLAKAAGAGTAAALAAAVAGILAKYFGVF